MTFLCGVLSTSNAKNEAINPDILCYALRFLIDIFLSLTPVCFFYSSILFCPLLPFLSLPDPHPGSAPSQVPPPSLPISPSLLLSLLSCFTRLICSMSFTLAFVSLFLPIFLLRFSKMFCFSWHHSPFLTLLFLLLAGLCHMHTLAVSHTYALPHFIAHTLPLPAHFPAPPHAPALSCSVSHIRSHLLFSFCASPLLLFFVFVTPFCCHPPSVCSFPLSPSPSLSFLFLGSDVIL